jgi:SAM-dependent methyltransferase
MAQLKIFVSSTSYDLRMVRSELDRFISDLGHLPVLSEEGDILYDPFSNTHQDCLSEVRKCDMLLLLVGSRYGGTCIPSVIDSIDIDKLKTLSSSPQILDNPNSISITQAEVLQAIEHEIPVYTYILDEVYHDHHLYEKNKKNENIINEIDFPSIQKKESAKYIFEFINFLCHRINNNSIATFSKPIDITNNLKAQLSGLLQNLITEKKQKPVTNQSVFANIQIVEGTEGYLSLLAKLIASSEREVLFTSTRMAGTNEGGVYGKLQKSIIESSLNFQKRNPNRVHYGIIDAKSVETSSGAAELRSKVPDIVLRFNDELNAIKVNFFISDENQVVLRMNKGGNKNRYSVLIQNKHLAIILKRYFYSLWNKSIFMSRHIQSVVENDPNTLEDVLESSGRNKAAELLEYLEFLNEIDKKNQIVPTRFFEKIMPVRKSHYLNNDVSALAAYQTHFVNHIGANGISYHDISEVKMRVLDRLFIDYTKSSKAFFVQYFLANYFKARHSLESLDYLLNRAQGISILDLGGGGGASVLAIVDYGNSRSLNIGRLDVVDRSEDQIEISKNVLESKKIMANFFVEDAIDYLERSKQKYDLIFAGNIFCESEGEGELNNLIARVKSALENDGKLLVVERTESKIYDLLERNGNLRMKKYMYQNKRFEIPADNGYYDFIDEITKTNISEYVKREYTLRYAIYEK